MGKTKRLIRKYVDIDSLYLSRLSFNSLSRNKETRENMNLLNKRLLDEIFSLRKRNESLRLRKNQLIRKNIDLNNRIEELTHLINCFFGRQLDRLIL